MIELLIDSNRPGTKLKPTTITVHGAGDRHSTARNARDYFSTAAQAKASVHYVVDAEEAIRCIPEDEMSWHAGPVADGTSISVLVCEADDPVWQSRCNENAAALLADILHRYGWGIDRIRTHQQWTGKCCPRKLLPIWSEFLDMVQRRLALPTKWGKGSDPLSLAVRMLLANGVISDPDYWLEFARPACQVPGECVYMMIVGMAQFIERR